MAFRYTEVQASGIEMSNSIGRSEQPMDIAEVAGSDQQKEASIMTLKALNDLTLAVKGLRSTQDKMITKVVIMEVQNKQVPAEGAYRNPKERKEVFPPRNGPPPERGNRFQWIPEGVPICAKSGKAGHLASNCYQRQEEPKNELAAGEAARCP